MTSRDVAGGAAEDLPRLDGISCPVPTDQQPLREYQQLLTSWFFAWPSTSATALLRPLGVAWFLAFLPAWLVASGSYALRRHPLPLLLAALVVALLLPLLLLVRQWLGWSYVRQRLMRERVEYEESGWYDGQVWEKPLAWRQRDLLVVKHQLQPVMDRLRRALLLTIALMSGGLLLLVAGLWQAL